MAHLLNDAGRPQAKTVDASILFRVVQEAAGLSGLAMKALGAHFEPCMCLKVGCIGYRVSFANSMHVTHATGAEFFKRGIATDARSPGDRDLDVSDASDASRKALAPESVQPAAADADPVP